MPLWTFMFLITFGTKLALQLALSVIVIVHPSHRPSDLMSVPSIYDFYQSIFDYTLTFTSTFEPCHSSFEHFFR